MPINKTVSYLNAVTQKRNTASISDKRLNSEKNAFTLIELLVVISIIALLVALSTVSFTVAQKKSRDGRRKSDLKGVQQALELYYQINGKYPIIASGNIIRCNNGVPFPNNPKPWGSEFSCDPGTGKVIYMSKLPSDPLGSIEYSYSAVGLSPLSYKLYAKLENTNDPDYCDTASTPTCPNLPCVPGAGYNYCQTNP